MYKSPILQLLNAASRKSLTDAFKTAIPKVNTKLQTFSTLYEGRFHLTATELKEAYKKSDRLDDLYRNQKFQRPNRCVGAVAETLARAAQTSAIKEPPPEGYDQWASASFIDPDEPIETLRSKAGPSGPSINKTKSEIMAEMIVETVKHEGPIILHYPGIGGADKSLSIRQEGNTTITTRDLDAQSKGPYGEHAICIAAVVRDYAIAVVSDPNDRSTHPAVLEFLEKNPDRTLESLTADEVVEHGLDKAMVYFVPLKEMLELSLLEYCEEELRQVREIPAKSVESAIASIKEAPPSVSQGLVYWHPNSPPRWTKPDNGLNDFVKELEKKKRIVTPQTLRGEIDDKKATLLQEHGANFAKMWQELHGEDLTKERRQGRNFP